MKRILQLLVLPFGLLLIWPASATAEDFGLHARIGVGDVDIGVRAGDFGHRRHFRRDGFRHRLPRERRGRPEPLLFGSGPVNDFARDQKRAAQQEPLRPRRRFRRGHRSHHFVPLYYYSDDYYEPTESERYVAIEEPAPEPEPAPQVEEAAPTFPDARGPRFEMARGRGLNGAGNYRVGAPLPRGVPHVALDWEDYGMPRPPAGQSYVRFGGAVLQIITDSRVVTRVLWPTEG